MRAFDKEITRSIRWSAGRFIAIVVISFLGAGFYAGLRMAAPDMREAADEFFDATSTYDLSVTSSLGLDDASLAILGSVEGVSAVMPAHLADALVLTGEASLSARVESLPDSAWESSPAGGLRVDSDDDGYLNRLLLEEGRWPAAPDECVVGSQAAQEAGIAVGDEIQLGGDEDDLGERFDQEVYTVVGAVNSPTFISSSQLGPTSLGSGSLDLYLYVPESAFAADDPYSVAYLSVAGAAAEAWDGEPYDKAVQRVAERVEAVAPEIGEQRAQAVKDELHFEVMGLMQEMSSRLGWADDIGPAEVHVLDRSKNPGAASLSSDAAGIAKIATFLPFMFFLVAALVSLTSMTRMVDEQRTEIGTHKALGYGRGRITSKYLIYGALASGIGAAAGIVALGKLLPWFIMTSYAVTYNVPVFPTPLDWQVTAKALGISLGVTLAATWGAAAASLREVPALLMLPRAPKAGKRIVLERMGALWQRMSFSHKVTARNLLRYKRRFFMAVVGVAGCTALLMVGFGLRDAIGGIVANQYGRLMSYDAVVRLSDDAKPAERDAVSQGLESPLVGAYVAVNDSNMVAESAEGELRIDVVIPEDAAGLGQFVTLRERESASPIDLDQAQVVLTEKAVRVLGVGTGDELVLYDENDVGERTGEGHAFVVGGIAENYLGHFAYMTPAAYEGAFGHAPKPDAAYVKLADGVQPDELEGTLHAGDGVATVAFTDDEVATYQEMLAVMDKLIVVIVLLSAALAFIVLYNLTNINIAERVREIATLKVLGFTRAEVNAYIFREMIVMALIGALVGCAAGVPLTFYIAEAAETSNMMFGRVIEPASFVFSFAITVLFAVLVAFAMRGKLAQVSMVESLKSVD